MVDGIFLPEAGLCLGRPPKVDENEYASAGHLMVDGIFLPAAGHTQVDGISPRAPRSHRGFLVKESHSRSPRICIAQPHAPGTLALSPGRDADAGAPRAHGLRPRKELEA